MAGRILFKDLATGPYLRRNQSSITCALNHGDAWRALPCVLFRGVAPD